LKEKSGGSITGRETETEAQKEKETSKRKIKSSIRFNVYELFIVFAFAQKIRKLMKRLKSQEKNGSRLLKKIRGIQEMEHGSQLQELPPGKRAIETKWIFKTKSDDTKKVLVAKGFMEEESFNIYAPVTRISTI